MILRVGFLLLASVAAFAVSQINITCSKNDDSSFQQEQNEEEEKGKTEDITEPQQEKGEKVKSTRSTKKDDLKPNEPKKNDCVGFESPTENKKWDTVAKIELLKNVVREMERRKLTLEVRLLEMYTSKASQLHIKIQLEKHLEAKMTEIDRQRLTVNQLKAEMEKLHEDIKQNHLARNQLEVARKRIWGFQAKVHVDEVQMKGHLMKLNEQFLGFKTEEKALRDVKTEKKLRGAREVELKIVEMKRRNQELRLETRELAVKLSAAQARATAISSITESRAVAKVQQEISSLRHANQDLSEQVEKLQSDRFSNLEELVYQRWLNACLRFENQEQYTPRQMRPSHDLEKKLSFESQDFNSISSRRSSFDSIETRTTFYSNTSSQRSTPKKGLFHTIKRWGSRSKHDQSSIPISPGKSPLSRKSLIRRSSTSSVPSDTSTLRKKAQVRVQEEDFTDSTEMPTLRRLRRVSFSDSVKPVVSVFEDVPKALEGEKPEAPPVEFDEIESIASNGSGNLDFGNETVAKETARNSEIPQTGDLNSEMPNVDSGGTVGEQTMNLIAAVLVFFLLLVLVFMSLSSGKY